MSEASKHLDDLLEQATKVIENPDEHAFQPVLILELLVALTQEVRARRGRA